MKVVKWLLFMLFCCCSLSPLSLSIEKAMGILKAVTCLVWKSAERICAVRLKMVTTARKKTNRVCALMIVSTSFFLQWWRKKTRNSISTNRLAKTNRTKYFKTFFRTFNNFISLYLCSVCHLRNSSSGFFDAQSLLLGFFFSLSFSWCVCVCALYFQRATVALLLYIATSATSLYMFECI